MEPITTIAEIVSPPDNSVLQYVTAHFDRRGIPDTVHLVQYDRTYPIVSVNLWYDGQPYTIPNGAAVNVRIHKPDGTAVYNPCLGISDNRQTAYISVTEQMTSVYGNASAIIEVLSGDKAIGTAPIKFQIDKNPVSDDAIMSSSEMIVLNQYVDEAIEAANKAEESQKKAAESELNASKSAESAIAAEGIAVDAAKDAADIATKPPIIRDGNWWTWDTEVDDYTDSGIDAGVSLTIGKVTTGAPGTNASVTNVGTPTDPILDFIIPRGDTGKSGEGTGDMLESIYDPRGIHTDIFKEIEDVSNTADKGFQDVTQLLENKQNIDTGINNGIVITDARGLINVTGNNTAGAVFKDSNDSIPTVATLPVSMGGTAKTSWTAGGVVYAPATNALGQVPNAAGALYKTAATSAPTFGTLPIGQGGTNATTAEKACENIGALPKTGGTISGDLSVNGGLNLNEEPEINNVPIIQYAFSILSAEQVSGSLSSYYYPGVYYSPNGTVTGNLNDKPSDLTVGFRMEVKHLTSENIVLQTIYPNTNGAIYTRRLNISSQTAYDWYKFSGTKV